MELYVNKCHMVKKKRGPKPKPKPETVIEPKLKKKPGPKPKKKHDGLMKPKVKKKPGPKPKRKPDVVMESKVKMKPGPKPKPKSVEPNSELELVMAPKMKKKPGPKPKQKLELVMVPKVKKKRGPKPKPKSLELVMVPKVKKKPGPKPKQKLADLIEPKMKKKPGPKPKLKPVGLIEPKVKKKPGPKPKQKLADVAEPKIKKKPGPKPKAKSEGRNQPFKKRRLSNKKPWPKSKVKTSRTNYSTGLGQVSLEKALTEYYLRCSKVNEKLDTKIVKEMSEKHLIPRKVLRRRIEKGAENFPGQGPATYLSKEEEKSIVQWCAMRFLNDCPVTKGVLEAEARRISGNRLEAGRNWYKGFVRRHPELDFNMKPEQFTAKRKAAKTVRSATQHFEASARAVKLAEELNGGPLEACQEANLDEKPVKSMDQLPRRVIGLSNSQKDCHFKALGDGNSFTTVEVIFADGTCLPTIYLFRGKKFPPNYDIRELDRDAVAFMTPEGGMNQEVWDEKVAPWIVDVWPLKGKWSILRLDGLNCHLHGAATLELFWKASILLFQERSASSEALQALDVSCYGPLSKRLRKESAHYTLKFGIEAMSQVEWPAVYSIAKKQTLTRENIIAGFRATGIWPRMTATEWLQEYGKQRGYILEDPTKSSDIRSFVMPTKLYDALDLAIPKLRKRIAPTPLPPPKKKRKVAPKTTQDGLPLAAAKILNKPSRISRLREVEEFRKSQFELLSVQRKKRAVAKEKRFEEEKKKQQERERKGLQVAHITKVLKAQYGSDAKFSMKAVKKLLVARGAPRAEVNQIKRSTIVEQ